MDNNSEIITAAITTLIGLIIRAFEKRKFKKQAQDGSNKEKI